MDHATITTAELTQLDEATLDGHRRALAKLPGDADAVIAGDDGRLRTLIDEDTLETVWVAQALGLLGPPNPATFQEQDAE